jgi:hypothetical protein
MSVARCGLVLLLLLTLAARASAQPREAPWRLTAEQLRDEGWEFERGGSVGSPVAGVLALTLGSVVHGVGHLYAGDERTGRALLIAEGVSVGLLATGLLLDVLTDSEGALAPVYRTFIGLGAGLFVATWLLDVIGSFKGGRADLPHHMGTLTDIRLQAGYRHLFRAGLGLTNVTDLRVYADLGAFYLHPRGQLGIDRGYGSFGTSAGLRFALGRRVLSVLDIQLDFDETIFGDDGFAYESIMASVGLSVDLGDAFAHLDGIVYANRLGFGAQLFRFDFDGAGPLNGDSVVSMWVVETSLSMNVADPLLLEVGYAQRPDTLVGNVSAGVGSFFGRVTWAFARAFDLELAAHVGRGIDVFAGTAFHFWPWSSN